MKRMIALDGAQGRRRRADPALGAEPVDDNRPAIYHHRHSCRAGETGLLRQHLTAVKAAAEICRATVEGAELGSQRLVFRRHRARRRLPLCYR